MSTSHTQSGFTLVELSIVIVIIGLIVSGVVAGQDLVRQASLRSILTYSTKIKVALNTFKLQYDAIPGDMPNAFSYWGTNCTTDADDCNGDGNRKISWTGTGSALNVESIRAWQHLQLADLLEGSLTGIGVECSSRGTIAGLNVPEGPFSAGWGLWQANYWDDNNVLTLGKKFPCWNHKDPIITPTEMANMDQKADDGSPLTGILWGRHNSNLDGDCSDGTTYTLSDPDIECYPIFLLGLR